MQQMRQRLADLAVSHRLKRLKGSRFGEEESFQWVQGEEHHQTIEDPSPTDAIVHRDQ